MPQSVKLSENLINFAKWDAAAGTDAEPVAKAAVLAAVREFSESGDRSKIAAFLANQNYPLYESDPNYPARLVQVSANGDRQRGWLIKRKFVAEQDVGSIADSRSRPKTTRVALLNFRTRNLNHPSPLINLTLYVDTKLIRRATGWFRCLREQLLFKISRHQNGLTSAVQFSDDRCWGFSGRHQAIPGAHFKIADAGLVHYWHVRYLR